MTPDTHPPTPTSTGLAHPVSVRERSTAGEQPSAAPSLDALSVASSAYGRMAHGERRNRYHASLALTLVAPIVVGVALASLGPLEYRLAATIKISGDHARTTEPELKNLLLQYAWSYQDVAHEPSNTRVWRAALPEAGIVELLLRSADRRSDLDLLRTRANAFIAAFSANRRREKTTKSAGEQLLTEFSQELEQELATVEHQIDESRDGIDVDPSSERTQLLQRWTKIRQQFKHIRQNLTAASLQLGDLRSQPEPKHGVVSRSERMRGIEADPGLTQDLKELRVNLTELKAAMLTIWQQCVVKLDAVEASQKKLAQTLSAAPQDSAAILAAEKTAEHAQQYSEATTAFRTQWSQAFVALRLLEVDPLTGHVLGVYRRVKKLLSAFLFNGGQYITNLRTDIQKINEDPHDDARTHVWRSEAIRHFHELQIAHHHFEFAASELDSRDNYKLDIPLRSARGLHRRCEQQIESIDKTLSAAAHERAIRKHHQSIAAAQHQLETIRATYDHIVAKLVTLQDELQISADLNEAFLKNSMQLELSKHDQHFARASLETTAQQLGKLKALRLAQQGDIELTLMDCAVIDGPLDLDKRMKLGGAGALFTLLVVGLGQWWLTRRG